MNLDKIQSFTDIVKLNSFAKAAEKNFITQAAISQQISSMENELGIKLLNRNRRGFTLTEAGQSFYDTCEKMLSTYSRGLSRARCISNNNAGFISIGIWPGFNQEILAKTMTKLFKEYPNCEFAVREGSPKIHLHYHRESKLALAVTMPYEFYSKPAKDLVISPLLRCGFNLCVSSNHPLANKEYVSINDVMNEQFVTLSEDYLGSLTSMHIITEQMQNGHLLMNTHIVPNYETQQLLVASGKAVMLIPEACVPSPRLPIRTLKLMDYPEICEFAAVWKSVNASPVLTRYIELLIGDRSEDRT